MNPDFIQIFADLVNIFCGLSDLVKPIHPFPPPQIPYQNVRFITKT